MNIRDFKGVIQDQHSIPHYPYSQTQTLHSQNLVWFHELLTNIQVWSYVRTYVAKSQTQELEVALKIIYF